MTWKEVFCALCYRREPPKETGHRQYQRVGLQVVGSKCGEAPGDLSSELYRYLRATGNFTWLLEPVGAPYARCSGPY